MYDVRYFNRATSTPGIATDCTVYSRREALQRAADLERAGTPAHVVDRYGRQLTDR